MQRRLFVFRCQNLNWQIMNNWKPASCIFICSLLLIGSQLLTAADKLEIFEGKNLYEIAGPEEMSPELSGLSEYIRGQYLFERIVREGERDAEKIAEAIKCLRKMLCVFPENRELVGKLLALHNINEDSDGLLDDLRLSAEANPGNALANTMYAETLGGNGLPEAGLQHIRAFLEREGWHYGLAIGAYWELSKGIGTPEAREEWLADITERHPEAKEEGETCLCLCEYYLNLLSEATNVMESQKLSAQASRVLKQPQVLQIGVKPNSDFFFEKNCSLHAYLQEWQHLLEYLQNPALPAKLRDSDCGFVHKCLALQGLGRKEEWVACLEMYLKQHANMTLEMIAFMTESFEKAEDLENALHLARGLVAAAPENIGNRLRCARLCLLTEKFAEGRTLLEPKSAELDFAGWMLLANLQGGEKDYGKACESFAQAEHQARLLEETEETLRGKILTPSFYLNYSVILDEAGLSEACLKMLAKLYEQNPDSPEICNSYGYTLADYGQQLDFAKSLIEKALMASPDNDAYMDSLAWVKYRLGDFAGALEAIEKIVNGKDDKDAEAVDSVILEHYADILAALDRRQEAVKYWEMAIKEAIGKRRRALEAKIDPDKPRKESFNPYER